MRDVNNTHALVIATQNKEHRYRLLLPERTWLPSLHRMDQ